MVYEVNGEYSGDGMSSSYYLSHHGIIGMKWGIRRYQNPDGTLTAEGRARYLGSRPSDKLAKDLRGYNSELGPRAPGMTGRYARLANSVPMKSVAAQVRKYWTESHDLDKKNRKIEKEYYKSRDYENNMRKAAEAQWNQEKNTGFWKNFDEVLGFYKETDRFEGQSFRYWTKHSNEKAAKEYLQNEKKQASASKKYVTECKKAVQIFLGEHGNETYDYKLLSMGQVYKIRKDLADRGVDIVTNIMNSWDTYSGDFKSAVPIEDLLRLTM